MIEATGYPLTWPLGWRRIAASRRKSANFKHARSRLTIAEALQRVIGEFRAMGIRDWNIIVSTNVEITRSGYPRSGAREPLDPGAAVYFRDSRVDGHPQRCIATDRYDRVADNLAAIAATVEAMRAIERHGGAEILDRAFTGFVALPAPARHWRDVLGVSPDAGRTHAEAAAYKRARSAAHPDNDGTPEAFDEVQRAYEQACMELPE